MPTIPRLTKKQARALSRSSTTAVLDVKPRFRKTPAATKALESTDRGSKPNQIVPRSRRKNAPEGAFSLL
jgi:hypothetical protein